MRVQLMWLALAALRAPGSLAVGAIPTVVPAAASAAPQPTSPAVPTHRSVTSSRPNCDTPTRPVVEAYEVPTGDGPVTSVGRARLPTARRSVPRRPTGGH